MLLICLYNATMIEDFHSPEYSAEYLKERSRKMMMGAALGDTLGMPIEGWDPDQIAKYLGRVTQPMSGPEVQTLARNNPNFSRNDAPMKYLDRRLGKGEWTDDTLLLLAVAKSIVRAEGFDLETVTKTHIELAKMINGTKDRNGWGLFGKTTQTALERLASGVPPTDSGVADRNATGNGPALKTAPIGIFAFRHGIYEQGLDFAEQVGKMTHKNPASVMSGVIQAHAVYSLLENVPKYQFLPKCVELSREFEDDLGPDYDYLTPKLEFILENPDMSPSIAQRELGNRFKVTESYPFALFMFNKYWDDPVEGMIAAVNMGGDADSVGAIYGALAGARGVEFPHEWQTVVKQKEQLNALAYALANI